MVANGRTVDRPSSIQSYISQRRSYLLALITSNVPGGFSITLNNGADFSTNRNLIALTGTAPIGVRILTINGVAFPSPWTSCPTWTAQSASAAANIAVLIKGLN